MNFTREMDVNEYSLLLLHSVKFLKSEYRKYIDNSYSLTEKAGTLSPDVLQMLLNSAHRNRRLRVILSELLWYADADSVTDANFRAILTDGQYVENSIVPKEGYTLQDVSLVITGDKLFGYRVAFNNNGNEEICYIYEAVSGIYDGNAEIDRAKIVSYFGEDRKCKIEDGKIYVENLKQLENLAIFTSNEESIVRIEDLEGKIIIASAQQSLDYVEAYFEAAGTYKMTVIAPDGTSKTYQIIVTGESLGKPFATVSAGKGAGKVTLEERFEEVEGGDRDFNGDFIIDDSSENIIFNGYFGKAMLSEIKTIKGKEYLDVTISSELIDNFYFDADFKNLINNGLNTLEVFETEDEQPVKYVRFYVAIELIGMKVTVECNVFLADLQKAGE